MENALKVLHLTHLEGFDVQTSLFSHRMVTIIFPMDGSFIPGAIANDVRDVPSNTPFLDTAAVSLSGVWDDYRSVHSTELYAAVEIETYSFKDAAEAQARVVDIVEIFLKTHTRTVTYTPND